MSNVLLNPFRSRSPKKRHSQSESPATILSPIPNRGIDLPVVQAAVKLQQYSQGRPGDQQMAYAGVARHLLLLESFYVPNA